MNKGIKKPGLQFTPELALVGLRTNGPQSDNGLAWLLNFFVSWPGVLGLEISDEAFEKLMMSLSGSFYLLRQFLNVDRDDFNKIVVCPKCTKLYKYDT